MEKLITVSDVQQRYGCSRQTARKYIRQCKPHMEKPLATTAQAFNEWEIDRIAYEDTMITTQIRREIKKMLSPERVIVPRRR